MEVRKTLNAILLLALITIKVASFALHTHSHHENETEDETPCELCEQFIQNSNEAFILASSIVLPENENILLDLDTSVLFTTHFVAAPKFFYRFSRPPPFS